MPQRMRFAGSYFTPNAEAARKILNSTSTSTSNNGGEVPVCSVPRFLNLNLALKFFQPVRYQRLVPGIRFEATYQNTSAALGMVSVHIVNP
jgi:hypothetical protein